MSQMAACAFSQVFVALLRAHQPEGNKELVRQALDVITPAMMRHVSKADLRYPIWIRYMKKLLAEDGHQINHLVHRCRDV